MKKIMCLILAVVAVCVLCACGNTQSQQTTDDYLKSYLAENSFTMEENGV